MEGFPNIYLPHDVHVCKNWDIAESGSGNNTTPAPGSLLLYMYIHTYMYLKAACVW